MNYIKEINDQTDFAPSLNDQLYYLYGVKDTVEEMEAENIELAMDIRSYVVGRINKIKKLLIINEN